MFKKIKRYLYELTHPVIGEVWQLHRVRDDLSIDEDLRTYEITTKRLESLIKEYLNGGYEFVSMDRVYDYVLKKIICKKKFIAVTLDDGYEDNFSMAYPIFKKYNVPFCVYVTQRYVESGYNTENGAIFRMMSAGQLNTLSKDSLCTIGSHTTNHLNLSGLNISLQEREIVECNQWLEQLLGKRINHFAYPFGGYNSDTLGIVLKINLKSAVVAWGGGVRVTKNAYEIPRVLVTEDCIR